MGAPRSTNHGAAGVALERVYSPDPDRPVQALLLLLARRQADEAKSEVKRSAAGSAAARPGAA